MRIDEVSPSKIDINKVVHEFRDFFKICMEVLDLDKLPKIQWISDGSHTKSHQSFGSFHNNDQLIQVEILNRHPIDIMRTLAHELVHYKQWTEGRIKPNSGETGSPEENEAHIKAGIIMRYFDRRNPEAFRFKPITENFADGKGPGRPGDSARHGIPKGATIAQLEKAAKAKGRKGQLARWQLNMRRGKKK